MENNVQISALLVMDMQVAIAGRHPLIATLTENLAKAIAHARARNIPVMYVVIGFRNGLPEISPGNKMFAAAKDRFTGPGREEAMGILPALAPLPGEIIITKRRVSAFTGSDLEVVLRAQGIQHLVLTGVATSGVVLSTLREAADKDLRISVLSDACADMDEEVHRVLTTKVFPRQADVLTVEQWCTG